MNLRRIRRARDLTQEQLSKLSNVDRISISKYERNVAKPSFNALRKLATVLEVSVDELMGDENETV